MLSLAGTTLWTAAPLVPELYRRDLSRSRSLVARWSLLDVLRFTGPMGDAVGLPPQTGHSALRRLLVLELLLELLWGHIPEGAMKAFTIIPYNPFEDLQAGFRYRIEMSNVNELSF